MGDRRAAAGRVDPGADVAGAGARRQRGVDLRAPAGAGVVAARGILISIVDWLRQRSRPYLFSNTLAPVISATTLKVLRLLQTSDDLRDQLERNSRRFREGMAAAGFTLAGDGHPIIPVMLGDARLAAQIADRLLDEGIFVIAFSFPVVPHGQARIRVQMSAAHSDEDVTSAVDAFTRVGREIGVLK